jgi:hypothetical protein
VQRVRGVQGLHQQSHTGQLRRHGSTLLSQRKRCPTTTLSSQVQRYRRAGTRKSSLTTVGPPMSLGRGFMKRLLKRSVYCIFESINKSLGPTQGSEDLQGQLSLHGGNVGPPVSVERFCEETSMKLRSSSVFVNILVCIYDY